MQAVILAGGLATRMYPDTQTTPKSLLEVAGRPFVDWQLRQLAASGIRDIVLCIAHLGEQIAAHVGDGSRFGVRVRYSDEGDRLLGTGGALRLALPLLAESVLVTYGDSFLPFDYGAPLRELDAHPDCDGVMAVFRNEGRFDASNVVTDGTWVLRYEKGLELPEFDHIDYGATAIRRAVLSTFDERGAFGFDLVQRALADAGRLRAFVALPRFFEIGSRQGRADLELHLANQGARPSS